MFYLFFNNVKQQLCFKCIYIYFRLWDTMDFYFPIQKFLMSAITCDCLKFVSGTEKRKLSHVSSELELHNKNCNIVRSSKTPMACKSYMCYI